MIANNSPLFHKADTFREYRRYSPEDLGNIGNIPNTTLGNIRDIPKDSLENIGDILKNQNIFSYLFNLGIFTTPLTLCSRMREQVTCSVN